MTTTWTTEPFRPPQLGQIVPACFLRSEAFLELKDCARVILHAHILHMVPTGVKRIGLYSYLDYQDLDDANDTTRAQAADEKNSTVIWEEDQEEE